MITIQSMIDTLVILVKIPVIIVLGLVYVALLIPITILAYPLEYTEKWTKQLIGSIYGNIVTDLLRKVNK